MFGQTDHLFCQRIACHGSIAGNAAQIQGVITRRLIRFENVVEAAAGKKLRFHDFQNFVRMFQTPGFLEDFSGEHLRQKHHGILIQISSSPAFSVDESRQAEFGR